MGTAKTGRTGRKAAVERAKRKLGNKSWDSLPRGGEIGAGGTKGMTAG